MLAHSCRWLGTLGLTGLSLTLAGLLAGDFGWGWALITAAYLGAFALISLFGLCPQPSLGPAREQPRRSVRTRRKDSNHDQAA